MTGNVMEPDKQEETGRTASESLLIKSHRTGDNR